MIRACPARKIHIALIENQSALLGHGMKIGFLLLALIVFGGAAANTSYAQQPPRTSTSPLATSACTGPNGAPGSSRGSVGGPQKNGTNVNGTGMHAKR